MQVPDTGEDDPLVAPCWGLVSDSPLSRRSVTSAPGAAMAYLVAMRDDRYRPADRAEGFSANEPIRKEVIELRPGVRRHSMLFWSAFVIRPKRCLIAWKPEASMCPGMGKGRWSGLFMSSPGIR